MIRVRDTRYDDPDAIGSLRNARRLWEGLARSRTGAGPYSVAFTYACPNEARALRVATALRRRLACAAALAAPSGRPRSELWHVRGRTHALPQSLANIEQISNWLRDLAASHQVTLIRLTLE